MIATFNTPVGGADEQFLAIGEEHPAERLVRRARPEFCSCGGVPGAQAGQTVVSIHTTPKGAQVAINQHIMDKNSPLDVALDPGNYVIDITMTGYAPIHKVVTANNGGKIVVEEVLQPAQ